jgi:cell division septal protein FtsQ
MKKQQRHTHPHARNRVLEVRVMSPRIAWLGVRKCLAWMAKLTFLLAILGGIGWAAWLGVQRALYQNPDFRLQVIALNPNPVIDELGVTTAAGIDLSANPSLFDLDMKDIDKKLSSLPAVAQVRVERHLPGTLAVTLTPRVPKAWLASASTPGATRCAGALLVDPSGVAYPCPEPQAETARNLPVIQLTSSENPPIQAGAKIQQPALESCLRLLDAAQDADPSAPQWIESIRQVNDWSLLLVTRQGTLATFGLGDHERQIQNLRSALDHASEKGYVIDTINLIPKYNIPITLREQAPPPRAIPVSTLQASAPSHPSRETDPQPKPH